MPLHDPEGKLCRCCGEGFYEWRDSPHLRITNAEDAILDCTVCGEPPMTFEEANEAYERTSKHHAADPQKHTNRGLVQSKRAGLASDRILSNAARARRDAAHRWGTLRPPH